MTRKNRRRQRPKSSSGRSLNSVSYVNDVGVKAIDLVDLDEEAFSSSPLPQLFDAIRKSFADGCGMPNGTRRSACVGAFVEEESFLAKYARTAPTLGRSLAAQSLASSERTITEIRRQRDFLKERHSSTIAALEFRAHRAHSRIQMAQATVELRDTIFHRRLEHQRDNANRRLQELMFECLGEYEKARLRASRRSQHLSSIVDNQLQACTQTMLWSHFLLRLEEELQTVTLIDVDSQKSFDEFTELQEFCVKHIAESGPEHIRTAQLNIERVVKVCPISGRNSRRQRDNPNLLSKVYPAVASAAIALGTKASSARMTASHDEFRNDSDSSAGRDSSDNAPCGASPLRIYPPGTSLHPLFDESMVLSSRPVAWLLLPKWATGREQHRNNSMSSTLANRSDTTTVESGKVKLTNCRIYFQVEERILRLAGRSNGTVPERQSLADHICSIYSEVAPGAQEASCVDHALIVTAAAHTHRDVQLKSNDHIASDRVQSYPDVLQVRTCLRS